MLKIDFAGKTELQTIRGIGPVVAENIVKYREMSGNITSNEDFRDIPHLNLDHNAIASIDFELLTITSIVLLRREKMTPRF